MKTHMKTRRSSTAAASTGVARHLSNNGAANSSAGATDEDEVSTLTITGSVFRWEKLNAKELVRSIWHAFPGFLAVWLLRAFYIADMPIRVWRAHPVALGLLPIALACWAVEILRLTPKLQAKFMPNFVREAFTAGGALLTIRAFLCSST